MDDLRSDRRFLAEPGRHFDFGEEKWGVVFLNRGGPESADEVEEYLYNLYSDPNVKEQPLSLFLQKPLAKILSSHRHEEIARRYDAIGGSPLLRWTRLIASNVRRELSKRYPQVEIFAGMRYSEPTIPDELDAAADEGCRHIVLLSMYPHYSETTTGTILEPVEEWLDDFKGRMTVSLIDQWYNRPEYVGFLRQRIATAMEVIDRSKPYKLLFVAHDVTPRVIETQAPYLSQLRQTTEAAGEGYDYALTYQRHNEAEESVSPDTGETILRLSEQGIKQIVVAPISYASDHFGTLYNIDIQLKEIAVKAGISTFIRTESFNDDTYFAAFLADLIEEKIESGAVE